MKTQRERILEMLTRRGERGANNYEFFEMHPPILRPAARILELRKKGYQITTAHVKGGVYKFILGE